MLYFWFAHNVKKRPERLVTMSKIASMLKALKRDKKSQSSFDEAAPGSRKSRTSVLDGESFVFLPGDAGVRGDREMYWGIGK